MAQEAPKKPQRGPQTASEGAKRHKSTRNGPRRPQDAPKRPQDAPKTPPRGLQTAPRSLQMHMLYALRTCTTRGARNSISHDRGRPSRSTQCHSSTPYTSECKHKSRMAQKPQQRLSPKGSAVRSKPKKQYVLSSRLFASDKLLKPQDGSKMALEGPNTGPKKPGSSGAAPRCRTRARRRRPARRRSSPWAPRPARRRAERAPFRRRSGARGALMRCRPTTQGPRHPRVAKQILMFSEAVGLRGPFSGPGPSQNDSG